MMRSADFLPMPGAFVKMSAFLFLTARQRFSGVMFDKMPSAALGPIPVTEMSI